MVLLASILLISLTAAIQAKWENISDIGGYIGSLISGIFLIMIAIVNLITMIQLWRKLKEKKNEDTEQQLDKDLTQNDSFGGGIMSKLCGKALSWVDSSYKMFPVGFLFGIGNYFFSMSFF